MNSTQKHIYILGGLGADERIFKHILFPKDYIIHHIHWIAPLNINEDVSEYAKRLLAQIVTPHPILIGVSFGGLMAVEISKLIQIEQLIVISSFKSKYEVPWYFKVFRHFPLHRIVPSVLLKQSNKLTNWMFGVQSVENKNLLKAILKDTDSPFLKWAINVIVNWNHDDNSWHRTVHIHGSNDRLIPITCVRADYTIDGGGHLMLLDKASEINDVLIKHLNYNTA